MSETIPEILRWLLFLSVYILIVGVFFIALRALLNRFVSSSILSYRLWLIFPLGIFALTFMPVIYQKNLIATKLITLEPLITAMLATTTSKPISWQTMLFTLWAVVAGTLLARLLFNYIGLKRALQTNSTVRGQNVLETSTAVTPLAFGFFSPKVYIPAEFSEHYSPKQQLLILSHEQQHCRRYDPSLRLIYKIINSLFWFHPIAYMINRAMKVDQEVSCDQLVLQQYNEAFVYSNLLLSLNQSGLKIFSDPNLKTYNSELYCAANSLLKERILMINKLKLGNNTYRHKLLGIGILFIAIIGLLATTVSLAVSKNSGEQYQTDLQEADSQKVEIIPIVRVHPRFPRAAVVDKTEGFVTMEFEITRAGTVENVRVVESMPETLFDAEAIRALKKFRFKPIPRKVTTQQTIEFKLEGVSSLL